MLTIKNISKSYGEKQVLNNVSLKISSSGLHIITGPNGSGKSTLLYLIAGLIQKDSGEISINGCDISLEYNRFCSYQFSENIFFVDKTINNNIKLLNAISQISTNSIKAELDYFQIQDTNKKMKHLSTGMMQKTKLAFTFSKSSIYYFFDEPTANLDVSSSELFVSKIESLIIKPEITVVIISHNIESYSNLKPEIHQINSL